MAPVPRVDRPWLQRVKLRCHELLSNLAFKFNLRRYEQVFAEQDTEVHYHVVGRRKIILVATSDE
jgi:hypothetical protein